SLRTAGGGLADVLDDGGAKTSVLHVVLQALRIGNRLGRPCEQACLVAESALSQEVQGLEESTLSGRCLERLGGWQREGVNVGQRKVPDGQSKGPLLAERLHQANCAAAGLRGQIEVQRDRLSSLRPPDVVGGPDGGIES